MQQILRENAYEAWSLAIKECNFLYSGFATLNHQKQFVSSLHNSVELFMKQIMLDKCDHKVANIRKVNSSENAQLAYNYYSATDLNAFFGNLPADSIDKFSSIEFHELINQCRLIVDSTTSTTSLTEALRRLQFLRNNETHFMISETTFLSEDDFILLFNFMIDFYSAIKKQNLLPCFGEPKDEMIRLDFSRSPLSVFSYKDALRSNNLAQSIIKLIDNSQEYGDPNSSSYNIADSFCSVHTQYKNQFVDVWAVIAMLQKHHAITYTVEVTEIPDELSQEFCGPIVDYTMNVNL